MCWRAGVGVVRRLVVMTIVLATAVLHPGPAAACSYESALSLDEVVAAGPQGTVPVSRRELPIMGIQEHTVTAWAPALVPVTSQRSTYALVRTWVHPESYLDRYPADPAGQVPYLGGLGDSCGPYHSPRAGTTILLALVENGDEVYRRTVGPEEFAFDFPGGITDDMRADLDSAFGPATAHPISMWDRVGGYSMLWWPHAVVASVAVAWLLRRARRNAGA